MKRAQLVVLGIAIAAGAGAMLMMRSDPPPPPPEPIVAQAPSIEMVPVLVAAAELPMGQRLKPEDLRWQDWPASAVPSGMITGDQGIEAAAGAITRASFFAGEPIRPERLIHADGGGFMSAILPAGMRAVAINIDSRGSSTAGGFVLPNDRVDIIRTYRDEAASLATSSDVHVSETILRNVRILAIGKRVQTDQEGNAFVDGETATLELTPSQAEAITLAQRTGQLSLVLRSLADQNVVEEATDEPEERSGMTVVRYGIARTTPMP